MIINIDKGKKIKNFGQTKEGYPYQITFANCLKEL